MARGEGSTTVRYDVMRNMWLGRRSLINLSLKIVVHRNLFSRVCVKILTFCANCISDSYSAIHTVHYTNTQTNNLPPHSARSVSQLTLALEDS